MSGALMLPDGQGLDPLCVEVIAEHGTPVHLRLTSLDGKAVRGACDKPSALGQFWSGLFAEVTCPDCRQWIDVA